MIDVTTSGHIGRITLNNPAKHNALDRDAMAKIAKTLQSWQDTDIRVVVLAGTGKSFCSGVSIEELTAIEWSDNPLETLCNTVENHPVPVICALQGGVFGGGVDLALACDFRIGVEKMTMFMPPARLGIHYQSSGIARAIQRLGAQMARRMFLMAEWFENDMLLRSGFLDFQVPAKMLDEMVEQSANSIASLAPMAVQGMKQTIIETSNNRVDTLAATARIAACFASNDHAEALKARKEKRAPDIKGD